MLVQLSMRSANLMAASPRPACENRQVNQYGLNPWVLYISSVLRNAEGLLLTLMYDNRVDTDNMEHGPLDTGLRAVQLQGDPKYQSAAICSAVFNTPLVSLVGRRTEIVVPCH
jgi:hypothetical protein